MIEDVTRSYLSDTLDVPVYMELPANAPATCIVLEKTGGSGHTYLHSDTLAVQSYAPSLFKAASLNDAVITAMEHMPEHAQRVYGTGYNTSYNYTDPDTKRYRYQAVFRINYYDE